MWGKVSKWLAARLSNYTEEEDGGGAAGVVEAKAGEAWLSAGALLAEGVELKLLLSQ